MKLDILVFAAHPDDAELTCSGTIALYAGSDKKVGIVDLTRGEMGTRGTPEIRDKEAQDAAKILGLAIRENLGFKDALFKNDLEHQLEVIKVIRKYQPTIVLGNAITDRHPDHGRGAALVKDACFMAGLAKLETTLNGKVQKAFRPAFLYHYIQNNYIEPDFIVDISSTWEQKMASILAYRSQFYNPDSNEPQTFISGENFLKFLEARAIELGHRIGAKYGEGFTVSRVAGVKDLFDLI